MMTMMMMVVRARGIGGMILNSQGRWTGSILDQSMGDQWRMKWHWRTFSFQYVRLPLSVTFHQRSTLIYTYMLLFRERQTAEAWKPSKTQCSLGYRWMLNTVYIHLGFKVSDVVGGRQDFKRIVMCGRRKTRTAGRMALISKPQLRPAQFQE